jgi:hypothetical protein
MCKHADSRSGAVKLMHIYIVGSYARALDGSMALWIGYLFAIKVRMSIFAKTNRAVTLRGKKQILGM